MPTSRRQPRLGWRQYDGGANLLDHLFHGLRDRRSPTRTRCIDGLGGRDAAILQGDKGGKGDAGAGVPAGGDAEQVLATETNADYATQGMTAPWRTAQQVMAAIAAALANNSCRQRMFTVAIDAAVAG